MRDLALRTPARRTLWRWPVLIGTRQRRSERLLVETAAVLGFEDARHHFAAVEEVLERGVQLSTR